MNGDRSKQESSFSRWVDHFWDGVYKTTKKGKKRIPSTCSMGKKYNRRWIRRQEKKNLFK
jgi:hypothetical protein